MILIPADDGNLDCLGHKMSGRLLNISQQVVMAFHAWRPTIPEGWGKTPPKSTLTFPKHNCFDTRPARYLTGGLMLSGRILTRTNSALKKSGFLPIETLLKPSFAGKGNRHDAVPYDGRHGRRMMHGGIA